MRNWMTSAAGAAAIGLAVAACSSSSSSSGPAASSPAASSPAASQATASASASSPAGTAQAAGAATVSLRAISGIPGKVLVGSGGRTLYLFEADKTGTSACSGACAAAWPPLIVTGAPHAGSGVSQVLLGTITRPDRTMQVTYDGHPLYYFRADAAAGAAHGQGITAFGAEWYVVGASGGKVDTS